MLIYDPETGDVFEKVVDKKDVYNDTSGATPRIYIAQDAINGENDSQKASAKLINLSYFSQLFTLWINDLYVTRYAIIIILFILNDQLLDISYIYQLFFTSVISFVDLFNESVTF